MKDTGQDFFYTELPQCDDL